MGSLKGFGNPVALGDSPGPPSLRGGLEVPTGVGSLQLLRSASAPALQVAADVWPLSGSVQAI